MHFQEESFYHIYNQTNRKDTVFRDREDYLFFLHLVKKWVYPVSSILAYCIMPNHYHFLISANAKSVQSKILGLLNTNELSNGFRVAQSQYAQFYNKKYNSVGSVFRPKTKSKSLDNANSDYLTQCFIYIHQNPVKANLCKEAYDWEYSSAGDYADWQRESLVDRSNAKKHVLLNLQNFEFETSRPLAEDVIDELFLKNRFDI